MHQRLLQTLLLFPAMLAVACSAGAEQNEPIFYEGGRATLVQAAKGGQWRLSDNRFYRSELDGEALMVSNTSIGSGISFVEYRGEVPAGLGMRVVARLEKEGLDGGWGVEFGVDGKKQAYRAMIYASGRFCVDRETDGRPEFIHCVNRLSAIRRGEAENEVAVAVKGRRLQIWVNGYKALDFTEERYRSGKVGVAACGAGVRVRFSKHELWDLGR